MLAANLEGSDTFKSALTTVKGAKNASNLESVEMFKSRQSLYEFRQMKCQCQGPNSHEPTLSDRSPQNLSYAESFLQYYYLSQRQIHFNVER